MSESGKKSTTPDPRESSGNYLERNGEFHVYCSVDMEKGEEKDFFSWFICRRSVCHMPRHVRLETRIVKGCYCHKLWASCLGVGRFT